MTVSYHDVQLPGALTMHYVEAGDSSRPTILLLHGFPSSSFQYRNLIPKLADSYHIIAPDLPGFGQTIYPSGTKISFDYFADSVDALLEHLKLDKYVVYVFDYGAPTAWRLALRHPSSVLAVIAQNGNAYNEGLGSWWDPLKTWWDSGDSHHAVRQAATAALGHEGIKRQYTFGTPEDRLSRIDPTTWTLDRLQNMVGHEDTQLDLFFDYRTNLKLYPQIQEWFRSSQVPLLAVWGKNDEIFPAEGAMAYKQDLPNAQIELLDGGHFLLETHLEEVARLIHDFLASRFPSA